MDLIHEIACIWVDALDNDEIKDRKKASLFKILMERRIDDDDDDNDLETEEAKEAKKAKETVIHFSPDEVVENDALLNPLKQLLISMPRHHRST